MYKVCYVLLWLSIPPCVVHMWPLENSVSEAVEDVTHYKDFKEIAAENVVQSFSVDLSLLCQLSRFKLRRLCGRIKGNVSRDKWRWVISKFRFSGKISNISTFPYPQMFQSILIGVIGFWGGVFCMGLLYLLAVFVKRVFKPEEAEKVPE